MILFACSNCNQKFNVKDEFADRTTTCPTCKQRLVVPSRAETHTEVQAGPIDGTPSSMMFAGVDSGITVGETVSGDATDQKPVRALLAGKGKNGERYVLEKEIARGGMGAVLRAVDCDLRREVAVKYMLDAADPKKKLRFVEEAQITGQLEHPNIVPIHELGIDGQKRMFFTMKMVRGRSLAQIFERLRDTPQVHEKEFPLGRLLTVFVGICHALAYAHSRSVVHRDLKPANVMVGDFGEVYVMDWGLAKVTIDLSSRVPIIAPVGSFRSAPGLANDTDSKVATSREAGTDLTQEGAIVGTPAYMPPEQACGDIHAIDQRSDVYSLGAILYEMLTLAPPVSKDGGHIATLMRVVEGEIVPPQLRDPQRARAGKIPAELSAVAMKALAKNPDMRYADVAALRRDVELFQEGRSVSAKHDTFREQALKLLKRNQGASITAAAAVAALLVLAIVSFWTILGAKADAERALQTLEEEQLAKQQRGKASAPLFVRDARQSADRKQLDYAMAQVDVALDADPDNAEARLVKAQLTIVQKDYAAAQKELKTYLKQRPRDKDAAELLALCGPTRREEIERTHAIADVFARQRAFGLALQMETDRDFILERYRQLIDAAWPGLGKQMALKDGKCRLDFFGRREVKDLTPLEGMPLDSLILGDWSGSIPVRDVTPLQGMPLRELSLWGSSVRDLKPLEGMPLTRLNLNHCRLIHDLKPLQGMELTHLEMANCVLVDDLTPLKGMQLVRLNLQSCQKVHDLSLLQDMPLTDVEMGGETGLPDLAQLRGMKLLKLHLDHTRYHDLSPLQDMPLVELSLTNNYRLKNLTPLSKLPLTSLGLHNCSAIEDLGPIRDLQLSYLAFPNSPHCKDLGLLRKMPIANLNLDGCRQIRDLRPLNELQTLTNLSMRDCDTLKDLNGLRGSKLTWLSMSGCSAVQDLSPLEGLFLQHLNLRRCVLVKDLTPLKGMPLNSLDLAGCDLVKDLTPLEEMNLQTLYLTPKNIAQGIGVIRQMKSLRNIGLGIGDSIDAMPAAEFWNKYDAGKF